MDIQISVRNLVEFIFREGDIDNRHAASPDAMQDRKQDPQNDPETHGAGV